MTIWNDLSRVWKGSCALCGARGYKGLDLCELCLLDLPVNNNCCRRCALPLTDADSLCGRCLSSPPAFTIALSPFHYETPCDYIIKRLKFGETFYFGRLTGELLADHIEASCAARPDFVVPVPLHENRLRERGFNQAEAIAQTVARRLNYTIECDLISRIRDTQTQMELPAKFRRKNVRNAFRILGSVAGARVALVDDVITTASTVNEIARILHKAGAAQVQVWSFARTAAHGINRTGNGVRSR